MISFCNFLDNNLSDVQISSSSVLMNSNVNGLYLNWFDGLCINNVISNSLVVWGLGEKSFLSNNTFLNVSVNINWFPAPVITNNSIRQISSG